MDHLFVLLTQLEKDLQAKRLPLATSNWQSMDVTIAPSRRGLAANNQKSFHLFIVTKYASELSWCFEQLVPAFCVDCKQKQPKDPFTRRLALAAMTCKRRFKSPSARRLCAAVWHEACSVYDEMRHGNVQYPPRNARNLINDEIEKALASGFIGPEATKRFASQKRREAR